MSTDYYFSYRECTSATFKISNCAVQKCELRQVSGKEAGAGATSLEFVVLAKVT
jgi:hypothetical protein